MSDAPDGRAVRDRRSPFCYQTHAALNLIREHFDGPKRATALAIYLCLTEEANVSGGAEARNGFHAARKTIADRAGVSADTLDRYVAVFVKTGLLDVERRTVEGVNLPNLWILTDPAPVPPVAAPVRPGVAAPVRPFKPKNENQEEGSPTDSRTLPTRRPRNVIYDALADACQIRPELLAADSPIYDKDLAREIGVAQASIRKKAKGLPDETLADEIKLRAEAYQRRWPEIDLTPSALAKHWNRVVIPAARRGLRPEEVESGLY